MPFGIRSAPEVHKLIEGMPQVEVIADDFVAIGKGSTLEEASNDHDHHLLAFLRLCNERGLKLNTDKLNLRQQEVSFIGHVVTGEGLKVDPAKVKAIHEMPPAPTDKASVQRLLGLAQYQVPSTPYQTPSVRTGCSTSTEWSARSLHLQSTYSCTDRERTTHYCVRLRKVQYVYLWS